MIQLSQIEQSYPFRDVVWLEEGKLINTERGKKALEIWTDEHALNHHIVWREKLAEKAGVLTNRMIQTVNGDKALYTDAGWITVHDAVEETFPVQNNPRETGRFLGNYLNVKVEDSSGLQELSGERALDDLFPLIIPPSSLRSTDPLLDKISEEAVKRVRKVRSYLKSEALEKADYSAAVTIGSLSQAKLIHGQLFWEAREDSLENGYKILRDCVAEWVELYGADKIGKVFDGINDSFSLEGDRGKLLLAHMVYPYDYQSFLSTFSQTGDDLPEKRNVERLTAAWRVSKNMTDSLLAWRENIREKVLQ